MKHLVLAAGLAIALAGCATGGSPSQGVEHALLATHQEYEAIGYSLSAAAKSGLLHGASATQAQTIYDQVGTDLKAADAAWDAGNINAAQSSVASANAGLATAATLVKSQ
jgi:hypothetical protein